jgi:hypothetical protein
MIMIDINSMRCISRTRAFTPQARVNLEEHNSRKLGYIKGRTVVTFQYDSK